MNTTIIIVLPENFRGNSFHLKIEEIANPDLQKLSEAGNELQGKTEKLKGALESQPKS